MPQLFLFMALLLSFPGWGANSYTLQDLEILAAEDNHEEFFKHAMDVRPSERLESWKAMVSRMSDSFTQKVLKRPEVSPEEFKLTENLYHWPVLKADGVFQKRRNEIGLRYLKSCLNKASTSCWTEVKSFWEKGPHGADVALELARLVMNHPDSPLPLWNFLGVALKDPLSEFYCQKDFVMEALWKNLSMDYFNLDAKSDLTARMDETMHPDCLPSLAKEARRRIYVPKSPSDRELGFQILQSLKKADQRISDFFHTIYLLERPSQGELFNYSWNRLKELGSAHLRREAVLDELKKLDPLPDELLGSLDQLKKRVILTHFKQHFPEYLDYYSGQCLHYYGGTVKFPKGNPTMHCQNLMSSEIAPQVFDSHKIKQYQEVRKI